MIEIAAAAARGLGVLAAAYLLGSALFLLCAGVPPSAQLQGWRRSVSHRYTGAAFALLAAQGCSLVAQAVQITGGLGSLAASAGMLRDLVLETWAGRVWLGRSLIAFCLWLLAMAGRDALGTRGGQLSVAVLAAAFAIAAPLAGHASGTESASLLVPLHMLHALALSAWLGGLPAWFSLARATAQDLQPAHLEYTARALQRFSRMATLCIAGIVVSGLILADEFIDDQGDLLGTRYGGLVTAKLMLLTAALVIAWGLRSHFLPALRSYARVTSAVLDRAADSVRFECLIGLALLVLGAWLAQTTPAVHDQPRWWLWFRISLEATWGDPASRPAILAGVSGCLLVLVWNGIHTLRRTKVQRGEGIVAGAAALLSLAVLAWGVSVRAYPDSFRRSGVAYLTPSIAQGATLFEVHCVGCHGAGGLGDGPLQGRLQKPPADLSAPHTALHTAGDMYWWMTHGIPESGMPGFAEQLDEEQRWDLVNFLRVFSQGFQARVLSPQILPVEPWLGAPNFYYEPDAGSRAELKDLRRRLAALLVFQDPEDPRSQQRLDGLRSAQGTSSLLALIVPSSADVWRAYQFLSRSYADRGRDEHLGMPLRHAEFLIDRFGYIRARWIPADERTGWSLPPDFLDQAAALAEEPEVLPPPDLHLH